jgi:hypothetical protein
VLNSKPRRSKISIMFETSNTSEISITSKEEAQSYLEQVAWQLLPEAAEKLRTALAAASKPADVLSIVDTIRSLAQVRKTSDQTAVATGAALGAALNPQAFREIFGFIGKAVGMEMEMAETIDIAENEETSEGLEIIEKMEETDEQPKEEEINEFQFGD